MLVTDIMRFFFPLLLLSLFATSVHAQDDLLGDDIQYSGLELDVVEYVQLPSADRAILSMSSPSFDDRLFVSASFGRIYAINESLTGNTPELWFDAREAILEGSGLPLNFDNGSHGGLRGFAAHPEFETNGKLYLSFMQDRPDNPFAHNYLGITRSAFDINADSVVSEFTFDHATGEFLTDSYRELFRVGIPVFDHPVKQIRFNQFARPGDDDYGLLYVAHGDAATQQASSGGGQNRQDALGKILRIDPLQSGDDPYSTPHSPFATDRTTLDEIYALGMRNPHNLSFAEDGDGESRLIVADIGRSNIEEINLVTAGDDLGWSSREGTFRHFPNGGSVNGVAPLLGNEANLGLTYPAVQFDHDSPPGTGFAGIAVAGAHVIANGSELDGQYIFGDFGGSGRVFHASFDEMLGAVTKLDRSDPDRDLPTDLTQATVSLARLNFDHDNSPDTGPREFDTFSELLEAGRSDFRFGEGSDGELYISSKRNGKVYLVTNSLSSTAPVDFNDDGITDGMDIDALYAAIASLSSNRRFDLNGDGFVLASDVSTLVRDVLNTEFGDADLNGVVDFPDFLTLSQNFNAAGGWAAGDFDGTGFVRFSDFLLLSQNYGSTAAAATAPEPNSTLLGILGFAVVCCGRRRGTTNEH